MSRSYKKNPVCKDANRGKKWSKNQANRRVRRSDDFDLTHKSSYKKIFPQWDICDHYSRETWEECLAWIKRWEILCTFKPWYRKPDDIEVEYKRWKKYYFRK